RRMPLAYLLRDRLNVARTEAGGSRCARGLVRAPRRRDALDEIHHVAHRAADGERASPDRRARCAALLALGRYRLPRLQLAVGVVDRHDQRAVERLPGDRQRPAVHAQSVGEPELARDVRMIDCSGLRIAPDGREVEWRTLGPRLGLRALLRPL